MATFDFSCNAIPFKDTFNFMMEERWGTPQPWRREPFIDDSDELTARYGCEFFETYDLAALHKFCHQCASIFKNSKILNGPGAITGPWKNLTAEINETIARSKAIEESQRQPEGSRVTVGGEEEGTPVEDWLYHKSVEILEQSAKARCHFCCQAWAHHQRHEINPWKDNDPCMELRLRIYKIPKGNLHMQIYRGSLFNQGLRVSGSRFIRCRSAIGEFDALEDREPHPAHRYFSTSSTAHMDLAKDWLSECHDKHLACRAQDPFLPTRLLHIFRDIELVSLYTTTADDKDIAYCTLSHCWGNATDILRLTSATVSRLEEGVSLSEFPRTFRDAITIARRLDISYIWIDSLCIFQDSIEDWAKESSMMGSIYEFSYVTIAAARAENAHRGCFTNRDPLRYIPCRVISNKYGNIYTDFEEAEVSFTSEITNASRWITRGWVFQERALSSRILFFGKRSLYWSCTQGQATELDPLGWGHMGRGRGIIQPFEIGGPKSAIKCVQSETGHQCLLDLQSLLEIHERVPAGRFNLILNKLWFNLVHDYSQLDLTNPEDKLVATSGIAKKIHERTGSRYCAGLWYRCFPFSLLWYVVGKQYPKPNKYRAPSWSWASIDGDVCDVLNSVSEIAPIDVIEIRTNVEEVELNHNPLDLSATGQVSGGYLKAIGPLKRVENLSETKGPLSGRYDITDAEGTLLGRFTPDTDPTDLDLSGDAHEIYALLVLSASARDDNGKPKFLGDSGYQKVVTGLALLNDHECYRRVGIIIHASKEQNPPILDWFSTGQDSMVIIK